MKTRKPPNRSKCSRPNCDEPTTQHNGYCKKHQAENMRRYRKELRGQWDKLKEDLRQQKQENQHLKQLIKREGK